MRGWRPVRAAILALAVAAAAATAVAAVAAPVDLVAVAGTLAGTDGGLHDATGRYDSAALAPVRDALRTHGRAGRRLWILIVPDDVDLQPALDTVAGRLAPRDEDLVVVASRKGVRARAPGLSGQPEAFSAAFEASRRELAADLPRGTARFADRLVEAVASGRRRSSVAFALVGLVLVLGAGAAFLALRRFVFFRSRWDREDAAGHARLVTQCEERLQKLATGGSGLYDRAYAELRKLSAQPPVQARDGLKRLADELERAVPEDRR
jgi:hypothetical protein